MNPITYAVIVTAGLFGAIFIYSYHSAIAQAWANILYKFKKEKTIERYKHSKIAVRNAVTPSGFPEIKRQNANAL